MATNWYQCKHCGTTVKQESMPNISCCCAKTLHNWTKLGEVGQKSFICKNCGTSLHAKHKPLNEGCPNAHSHAWKELVYEMA